MIDCAYCIYGGKGVEKKHSKFDLLLGSTVLILMVAVVCLQVVFRYFGHPLSWPEEVARWTMIWVTFAGASYAFKNGGLIRVEYFVQKHFKPRAQYVINVIDMGLLGGLFCYLSFSSVRYIMLTLKKKQAYNVTQMPYAVVVSALLLGGILCMIFSIKQILDLAHKRQSRREGRECE